jgi:GT2 family glycosyltransferase
LTTSQSENAGTHQPTISVIVVNLNGEDFLLSCIASALAQDPAPEIIVVDNGSTDNSVELIGRTYPHVKVIRNEENLGFAGPANQGAALASGELLLFLNNDARLMPGTLARLVDVLQADPKVAACEPTMRRSDGRWDSAGSMFTKTGFLYNVTEDDISSSRFGPYRFSLKGACLLVRADLFNRAGRFDDSYFAYFEETDLCWRLLAMGYRLKHVDNAFLIHDVGRTTMAIFQSAHIDYLSFRNRITTIRKNGDTRFKLRVLPVHLACCLGVAVAFAVTGKRQNALSVLRAMVWHLRPSNRGTHLINRPAHPASMEQLSDITVPVKITTALRMLRAYLIRW